MNARRRFFALVAPGTLAFAATCSAQAPEPPRPVRPAGEAIRAAITAQLEAFAADDEEAAFALASKGLQDTYRTPSAFVAMVRSNYPPVYRATHVSFHELARIDRAFIQVVRLTDPAGEVWHAMFQMSRHADGSWRIAGCVLRRAAAQDT